MFHKIENIEPLPDYTLFVQFKNKEKKQYSIKKLAAEMEPFKALLYTAGLFNQVNVDPGGYGISWNDELDLSCNELYYNGIKYLEDGRKPLAVI